MPASHCPFPEHHGSSGGSFPVGPLLAVLAILIIASSSAVAAFIHALLIAAGITAGILLVGGGALLAWRLRSRARQAAQLAPPLARPAVTGQARRGRIIRPQRAALPAPQPRVIPGQVIRPGHLRRRG